MKKILSIFILLSSIIYGQTIQPGQLAIPTGSYLIGVTSGTKSVGSATATIPLSKITGTNTLLPATTSITINGSTQSLSVSPSFSIGTPSWDATLGVDNTTSQSPIIYDGNMSWIESFGNKNIEIRNDYIKVQNSPSIPLFEANTTNGDVNINGNSVTTTANTQTLTNKTYSNAVNTGTTQASIIQSNTSAGINIHNQSGSDCFISGAGGGINNTAYGSLKLDYATGSTLPVLDASKNLISGSVGSNLTLNSGTLSVSTSPTFTNATLTGTTTLTGVANFSMSSSVASSATVNLAALTGNVAHITGTTSITSLGTVQAGAERTLIFDGALTLTSNTLSLILPGNTDIVTAANDVATFISEGSGNWRMISYLRNDESYVNYTPSFTGFSATPTITAGEARYKMLSKNTCHVIIWISSSGTSNSTSMTVTLPFPAAYQGSSGLQESPMMIVNNGTRGTGSVRTRAGGSNILDVFFSTFSTSGLKDVRLNFVYQTTN